MTIYYENLFIMNVAINDSRRLKGIAYNKIPCGNTPKLPMTIHIITNPIDQERKVVCIIVNLFDIIKIVKANKSDQSPQIAPFIGSEGK